MFFTLDRIEDCNIAVLCDDNGRIHNVPVYNLPDNSVVGDVFICKDGKYIFHADETDIRRTRTAKKKK